MVNDTRQTSKRTMSIYYKQTKFGLVRTKPDLKEHYAQKEQEHIQRIVELEDCGKIIRKMLDKLSIELQQHPNDIVEIEKACRSCVEELRKRLKERDFKSISKFDIERAWKNAKEQFMRIHGMKKQEEHTR